MAILRPDTSTTLNGVKINEYLLTKHNPNRIDMPSVSMEGKVIGVTVHNTDWISVAMALLYGYDIDTILQSGMWYYPVDLSIKNESELADLVSEYNRTKEETGKECLIIINLVEKTEKNCRLAHVGICDDGSYKILYQSIK